MREIIYWVHRQEEADREIAAKIPAIARQSERENAPKGGIPEEVVRKTPQGGFSFCRLHAS